MAIRMFFMANLDYAAAAGASCGGKQLLCHALCVVGPLTDGDTFWCKEGQNVLDFGASQLVGGGDWLWCKEAVDGGHPCR